MTDLTTALKALLTAEDPVLVGCCDLSTVPGAEYPYGVAIALPVRPEVVKGIKNGSTEAYFAEYHAMEARLREIALRGERFLQERGYRAFAQTSDRVHEDADWKTELPHKTVAVLSGIGWIGKSCLLVTEEYGSAVRLTSILTDTPLACGTAALEPKCGSCKACAEGCPAHAMTGTLWHPGIDRAEMLNKEACCEKQIQLTWECTGISDEFLCGRCFAACPFTRRYITHLL